MAQIAIGNTGLFAEQNGFGALPIQRISKDDAVYLLRKALDGGITYFDSSRAYTDSEEKLGAAFFGLWDRVIIATKTPSTTTEGFWNDLEDSLRLLKTDHIDIYQFHNTPFCPKPDDGTGLYEAMLKAKEQGKIRFIGITNHRMFVAREAIQSGLYDTLQYPFNYLSTPEEFNIVDECRERGIGFIAMKGLSGGLLNDSAVACAFIAQYSNVLPIWGIQREWELDEFLSYTPTPPILNDEMKGRIAKDREMLQGDFCRACSYCMPCPQGIEINTAARMSLLLRRAPSEGFLSEGGQALMKKIENCVECGKCASKCPYGLDTPSLLKRNYKDYLEVLAGKPL
ncbi:MAG: aldo/keto reductase [Lachnospiraceae bacterium]|nr:aldo/keto reductase [Lachnospiraceae bacterium]